MMIEYLTAWGGGFDLGGARAGQEECRSGEQRGLGERAFWEIISLAERSGAMAVGAFLTSSLMTS